MRYVRAKLEDYQEVRSYREYVTESLRLAGENKYLSTSWRDLIKRDVVDSRTADEIAQEIFIKAGLKTGGEN